MKKVHYDIEISNQVMMYSKLQIRRQSLPKAFFRFALKDFIVQNRTGKFAELFTMTDKLLISDRIL